MKTTFRSNDFSCPSCVKKIESALKSEEGVEEARVHFNTGRIDVTHDPDKTSSEKIISRVRELGYEIREAAF